MLPLGHSSPPGPRLRETRRCGARLVISVCHVSGVYFSFLIRSVSSDWDKLAGWLLAQTFAVKKKKKKTGLNLNIRATKFWFVAANFNNVPAIVKTFVAANLREVATINIEASKP